MSAPDLPPPPEHVITERPLHVHLHVSRVKSETLAGGVVVVIDAIRASVTIAQAFRSGAKSVVPVLTGEDAKKRAAELVSRGVQKVLLGGERGGLLIEGFDLDNSPFSYTQERVEGSTIVFTTSNGTAGLLHARHAAKIVVGSFSNLTTVCEALANEQRPVHILCCGTRDDVSLDDVLVGGAMAERLVSAGRQTSSDDSWSVAMALWKHVKAGGHAGIVRAMEESRGGRNMVKIGLARDVEFCSTMDTLPVLPVFDAATGLIQLA
ncbi:MAG: 2-phosphosulfolactate phosphatase [Phycisphaerales bacterium]